MKTVSLFRDIGEKTVCYFLILLCSSMLIFSGCDNGGSDERTTSLNFSGIEFMPNVYLKDGALVGIDVDITKEVIKDSGLDVTMELAPSWSEAYDSTLNGSNRALLTVGYSKERRNLFKWAGPISKGGYGILSKARSGVGEAIGIDAAKDIESIAVVRNWLETTTLEEMGFSNLVYFDSYSDTLNAFKNDEVKSIATDIFHFTSNVTEEYYRQENIQVSSRYRTVFYYIAFSLDVSDDVVQDFQDKIDELTKDQTLFSITQKYVPYATARMAPSELQLFTEVAAPFNFHTGINEATVALDGSSYEIVNKIQSRIGKVNPVSLTSWADAYSLVQYLPNSALFTVARTEEREKLFQWVGPIANLETHFYTRLDSGIKIETLEQAKALSSVATPRGWYTHDYLKNNGFQNIVATSNSPEESFQQLENGEVDAVLLYDSAIEWLSDGTSDLSRQLQVSSDQGYIAFSLETPREVVKEWQDALASMKSDGSFETIWNSWFEQTDMP